VEGSRAVRTGPPRGGEETARLLAFSDGVFALAATLLVVTLTVPESYGDLREAVAGFPAFALAFAAIVSLWYSHRQFFCRYPLGDGWTVAVNGVLLFIVVLYVYPLKLMAQVFAERFLGVGAGTEQQLSRSEVQGLLLVFGAAVLATAVVLLVLHARAWQRRADLALDTEAVFQLRTDALALAAIGAVAVVSMTAAAVGVGLGWGLPVWLYLATPVVGLVQHRVVARRPRRAT
jgi:uncharacterized membrane protein